MIGNLELDLAAVSKAWSSRPGAVTLPLMVVMQVAVVSEQST